MNKIRIKIVKTMETNLTYNEFLANNLFVYIEKDIISLFSIHSIINKIDFLKRGVPNFSK